MLLVKKILEKLNGLHYRQEYLCFAKEAHVQPLHAYLVSGRRILKDVTTLHLFTGYHPLIFAFTAAPGIEFSTSIQLIFSQRILQSDEFFSKKDALALLDLQLIKKQQTGQLQLFYFEGKKGAHRFLPFFHRFINNLNNRLFNKIQGNVFLRGNLYRQVQVAYAIPRIISLITVGAHGLYNLFPTDLHGQAGEQHYIISLRVGGKACEQVESAGKLLISQVHCNAYKTVYSLGKNHMKPLRTTDHFPFTDSLSAKLALPLPQGILFYRELMLQTAFVHGIHKIFLFKIEHQQQITAEPATLAHIHNSYASWRHKNNMPGNYLLR